MDAFTTISSLPSIDSTIQAAYFSSRTLAAEALELHQQRQDEKIQEELIAALACLEEYYNIANTDTNA